MAISFKGAHFPKEVILMGVRWYVAYPLSTRHVEELMEERGVEVDHSTIKPGVLVKRGQSKLPAFGTLGTFGVCHIPGPLQTAGWPLSSLTQSLVSAMCLSTPRS